MTRWNTDKHSKQIIDNFTVRWRTVDAAKQTKLDKRVCNGELRNFSIVSKRAKIDLVKKCCYRFLEEKI